MWTCSERTWSIWHSLSYYDQESLDIESITLLCRDSQTQILFHPHIYPTDPDPHTHIGISTHKLLSSVHAFWTYRFRNQKEFSWRTERARRDHTATNRVTLSLYLHVTTHSGSMTLEERLLDEHEEYLLRPIFASLFAETPASFVFQSTRVFLIGPNWIIHVSFIRFSLPCSSSLMCISKEQKRRRIQRKEKERLHFYMEENYSGRKDNLVKEHKAVV